MLDHELDVGEGLPDVAATRARADAVVREHHRAGRKLFAAGGEHVGRAVTPPVVGVDIPADETKVALTGHGVRPGRHVTPWCSPQGRLGAQGV